MKMHRGGGGGDLPFSPCLLHYKLHILSFPNRDRSLIASAPKSHWVKAQTGFIVGADQYKTRGGAVDGPLILI